MEQKCWINMEWTLIWLWQVLSFHNAAEERIITILRYEQSHGFKDETKYTSLLLFLKDLMIVLIVVVTVITLAIITVILVLSVKRYRRYKSEIHRPDGLFKVRAVLIFFKRKSTKGLKYRLLDSQGMKNQRCILSLMLSVISAWRPS